LKALSITLNLFKDQPEDGLTIGPKHVAPACPTNRITCFVFAYYYK